MDQANVLRHRIRLMEAKANYEAHFQKARVLTVTSGKGGVGKTNFALNTAINLSNEGKKVILIDADFGLANVEILYGETPKYTMYNIFTGERTIEEIIMEGPNGTKVISGGSGFTEMSNLNNTQLNYVLKSFAFLDKFYDYILIDTGAGMNNTVVKIIKASKETIIMTTPEPTSIKDACSIIESITIDNENDPIVKIVVNRTDEDSEVKETFAEIKKQAQKYLETELELLGGIREDRCLVKSVKAQKPVALLYPNCDFSKAITKMSLKLLNIERETQETKQYDGILSYVRKIVNIFSD